MKRHNESMPSPEFKAHLRQFLLYIVSGGTSAIVEFGSYVLLLRIEVWYIVASVIAFILSYITAFLLHKYIVFRKPEDFLKHLRRHAAVEASNILVGIALLYVFVEYFGLGEEWGKIITMGLGVLWNFVLFKFLVFV